MPKPRPSRPPARPRASPEMIRLYREKWPIIQWNEAVDREVGAMMCAVTGPWHITEAWYVQARHKLIERGVLPPPGFEEREY